MVIAIMFYSALLKYQYYLVVRGNYIQLCRLDVRKGLATGSVIEQKSKIYSILPLNSTPSFLIVLGVSFTALPTFFFSTKHQK